VLEFWACLMGGPFRFSFTRTASGTKLEGSIVWILGFVHRIRRICCPQPQGVQQLKRSRVGLVGFIHRANLVGCPRPQVVPPFPGRTTSLNFSFSQGWNSNGSVRLRAKFGGTIRLSFPALATIFLKILWVSLITLSVLHFVAFEWLLCHLC
jgi:hypothetical protein